MIIPTLPLAFIGWIFAVVCFAALAIGTLLLQQLFRSGRIPPEYLQSRIIADFALLLVWLIGLVSAFALLNDYSWGRLGLEYFCWVLIVLTLLSGGTRLLDYRQQAPENRLTPRAWVTAIAGVTLVALPLIAICAVSIHTLRGAAMH
jgi:ABC-type spermidine/putrescine transport system permease subunit II